MNPYVCPIITDVIELRKVPLAVSLEDDIDLIKRKLSTTLSTTSNGVGLAAPQIGIRKAISLVRTPTCHLYLINPCILKMSTPFEFKDEGCLSFPGKYINTRRFREVTILNGFNFDELQFKGFDAVVIQHEIDHLTGKTMYDHQIVKMKGE